MGTGHVMRCIALSQAWQDAGGTAAFAMAQSTEAVRTRLASECCELKNVSCAMGTTDDVERTVTLAQELKCDWVVVDGYHFGADYQRGLGAAGLKVLFVDDYGHSQHYSADVVLNQNLSSSGKLYSNRESWTRLLLGPRYALLRREFNAWRDWERRILPNCHRVLVTMGGSDERNVTATVIKGLCTAALKDLEATVLVGGSNPHLKELQGIARGAPTIKLVKDVSDVGEFMAAADIAISAAGTTVWELCLLGLPSVLIDVADNQTAVAKELHQRGCAIHIGTDVIPEVFAQKIEWLCEATEARQSLSRSARELVDGKGATRVVCVLRGTNSLRLRAAVDDNDRRLLWEWANNPEVRAASFSPDPISWETHVAWFNTKLNLQRSPSPKSMMFIAEEADGRPLGQIRFDLRADGDWEVSISVESKMRGQGLATQLIKSGLQEVVARCGSARIHAFIKPENTASVRAFERAAFRYAGRDQVRGHPAIHLTYTN